MKIFLVFPWNTVIQLSFKKLLIYTCIVLQTEVKYCQMSSDKTILYCLLTHEHNCCDTKLTESIYERYIASKKMVPLVKPLSYF